ncbi:MAG: hypothetical protein U0326_06425 [Polyangiales bacterium]
MNPHLASPRTGALSETTALPYKHPLTNNFGNALALLRTTSGAVDAAKNPSGIARACLTITILFRLLWAMPEVVRLLVLTEVIVRAKVRGGPIRGIISVPPTLQKLQNDRGSASASKSTSRPKPIRMIRVAIPVTFNDGRHVPIRVLANIVEKTFEVHGGATIFSGYGACKPDTSLEIDGLLALDICTSKVAKLERQMRAWCIRLRQRAMMMWVFEGGEWREIKVKAYKGHDNSRGTL